MARHPLSKTQKTYIMRTQRLAAGPFDVVSMPAAKAKGEIVNNGPRKKIKPVISTRRGDGNHLLETDF